MALQPRRIERGFWRPTIPNKVLECFSYHSDKAVIGIGRYGVSSWCVVSRYRVYGMSNTVWK